MKILSLVFLTLISTPSFACQEEALIIGEVLELSHDEDESCSAIIGNLNYFRESIICPLSKDVVINNEINLGSNCSVQVGEMISGVVIQEDFQLSFE